MGDETKKPATYKPRTNRDRDNLDCLRDALAHFDDAGDQTHRPRRKLSLRYRAQTMRTEF